MLAHCCGHATIVARRQPLFGFINAPRAPTRLQFAPALLRSPPEGDRWGSFSVARFAAYHRATKLHLATTHASPRIARRDSESQRRDSESQSEIRITSLQQLIIRSPCRDSARRKLQRLTSIVLEAITSFLCGRHFLHLFSSRADAARHARASAEQLFIRQTKQRRAHFVADVSITERSDRCAEGQVAEMPFASPYCP
jgi:hypothetical protein